MAVTLTAILGGLFVLPANHFAQAATRDSLTVTIGVRDIYAPSAITDLTATSGAQGQMLLGWTAPDANNYVFVNHEAAASYIVKIATFSIDSLAGDTTAWWNLATDVAGEPLPSAPGVQDFLLLNGLNPGVTYYSGIKSVDSIGLISDIDVNAATPGQQANVEIYFSGIPLTPTNFVGTALSTETIQWTWDLSFGATFYRIYAYPSGVLIGETTNTFITEGGFELKFVRFSFQD